MNTVQETEYHSPSISTTSQEDDDTKFGKESPCVTADTSSSIDDTLILLDWDDTLFPTSMIVEILRKTDRNGFSLVPDFQIELLSTLGTITLSLLTQLIQKYGATKIRIVTNSTHGWIEDSLRYASCITDVYKRIQTLLINYDIAMESAQTRYGENHEGSTRTTPTDWKRLCFNEILNENEYAHIISIGDQWVDHISVKQSIHLLSTYTPLHHVIKLKSEPMIQDLINEMRYIQTCFEVHFNVKNIIKPVIVDYHREEMSHYLHSIGTRPQNNAANTYYV